MFSMTFESKKDVLETVSVFGVDFLKNALKSECVDCVTSRELISEFLADCSFVYKKASEVFNELESITFDDREYDEFINFSSFSNRMEYYFDTVVTFSVLGLVEIASKQQQHNK